MTNERMIEIMELIIQELQAADIYTSGLCMAATRIHIKRLISEPEKDKFNSYIENVVPRSRWDHPYKWERGNKAVRIKWLKQQIEILKTTTHATPNTMP